jgi:hypothetical protein
MSNTCFRHILALAFFSLFMTACDSGIGGSLTCNLTAELSLDEGSDFSVTYEATRSGDGSISSLTYTGAAGGRQTVTNPSLPWTHTETMVSTAASMTAGGEVTDGSLTINLEAVSGGLTLGQSDACSQS